MKRFLFILLFVTPLLSAKYLYMGHFSILRSSTQQMPFTVEGNAGQNLNIQSVFHCFNDSALTMWAEQKNNTFITYNITENRFGQLVIFVTLISDNKDAWMEFEYLFIKDSPTTQISRKIVEIK